MQLRKWVTAALLMLNACGGSDSGGNYSTPRKTAIAVVQAGENGDAAGIKAASFGADPAAIDAMAASISSEHSLANAVKAKFGPDAKVTENSGDTMQDFTQRLNDAQININGDTATITITGMSKPWLNLKKIDGQWKEDLSALPGFGTSPDSAGIVAIWQKLAAVNQEMAAEVAAGKYATIDAVKEARMQKIKAAIQNMPSTRASGS